MRSAALVLAIVLAGSLSACTGIASSGASSCVATPAGSVSNSVSVTGKFGSKPTVKINAPLSVATTERSVVIPGKGTIAATGSEVAVNYTLVNGKSGAVLNTSDYTKGTEQNFLVNDKLFLVGLIKTIHCAAVGSRVVGVIPPGDAWKTAGSTQLGVAPGDSIVFVADIVAVLPTRATGVIQPVQPGLPSVAFASDGAPTITIPKTPPPAKTTYALLKKGAGAVLKSGDKVRLQYVGVNWTTGKVFDETWGQTVPIDATTDGFIPGFNSGLVGQRVNSQILMVIPPADGYGTSGGPTGSGIGGTDTIVFVVDILPPK